jgi:hypothetical protein
MKSKRSAFSSAVVESELAEAQLALSIARFDPENQEFIRAVRAALRKRMPTAFELVYDNYNFLVIGDSSTERSSDCIVSLAADAHGIQLMFFYGATLLDPTGILRGSGSQNRSIRLQAAEDLAEPEIDALVEAAVAQGETPLPARGGGYLIIKSISAKQRPRR